MENELKTNAVSLTQNEQYEIRKQIVRLHKSGEKVASIANITDVSIRHVQATIASYKKDGIEGIKTKKRGRRSGEKRVLTVAQEKEIQKLIVDKYPEQMKLKGCLWTRENIAELIKRLYKISIPLSTLSAYLKRWGFSSQRPSKQAYKQKPEHVEMWLKKDYPAIAERAKAEKADIYWGDETGVQNESNFAKGYAPIGETPVLVIETTKFKINMISAITNQGKVRFMIYKENMNCKKLIEFLRRLITDAPKKVFLILDNLRVHHGILVQKWLAKNKEKIEIFYLPPYSPEYNPDEYLNGDLKRNIGTKAQVHNVADIERNTRSFMKKLQFNKEHVKSYFKHKKISYSA